MKHALRALALSLLATAGLAASAQADTQEVAGVVWRYTIVSNAVVIGEIPNTNYTSAISRDTAGELVIPSELGGLPVVDIGPYAFSGCTNITAVTIPDAVTNVSMGAFSECASLTEFKLPGNAVRPLTCSNAEEGMFFGCVSLRSVRVPYSISILPNYAFANCVSLKELNFEGDCPTVDGNELLVGTPKDMIVNVKADALGWYDPISYSRLGMWQHRRVAYDGVCPEEIETISDDDARNMLYGVINFIEACGATMTDDEKRQYWYSVQNIIDCHPALLDIAVPALETLGVTLTPSETNAYTKWAMSVATSRLTPIGASTSDSKDQTKSVSETRLTVTNVVLHYVVNSITPDIVVPITKDTGIVNVMTEIMGGNVAVPDSWATNYPTYKTVFGSDFAASLTKTTGKHDASGKPMMVWQDFVAGTDPTDENDIFLASVTMVDNKPVISYTPELNEVEKAKRKYTTWGKVKLQDAQWTEVPSGNESDYNFFKVTVEMR